MKFGFSILLISAASACFAQQWEFGGVGGAGFLSNVNVSSSLGSAKAGFQPGGAVGVFFGQSISPHIAGEIRYEFLQNNLQLSSSGSSAHFTGYAHALHYDIILHTNRKNSAVQFFAALGGGMKIFQGTGAEQAYQALSQYGYFTKTHAVKPMASVGAGITYKMSQRMYLRTEFRDFITMFPTELITPAPGAKFGSVLHDFVPMVGLDYVF
jgi:Outer membrane protein beta-barrel domain